MDTSHIHVEGHCAKPYKPYFVSTRQTRPLSELVEFLSVTDLSHDLSLRFTEYYYDAPGPDDLRGHISRFVNGDAGLGAGVASIIEQSVAKIVRYEADVPQIRNWLNPSRVSRQTYPPKSSPGPYYKLKYGYNEKRLAYPSAVLDATLMVNKIQNGTFSRDDDRPAGLAGRGRRVDIRGEAKPDEGRLILTVDFMYYLVASLTSQVYTKILSYLRPSRGGVMIGLGPFGGKWGALYDSLLGDGEILEFDFSRFDSTVPPAVIKAAYSLIKSRFEDCPGKDAYFAYLRRNMISTVILDPSGTAFRKKGGIASGDPYTSIVGSYCNMIMCIGALTRLGLELGVDYDIWAYGDDGLIKFYSKKVDKAEFTRTLGELFGMIVKEKATKVSVDVSSTLNENGEWERENVTFLHNNFTPRGFPIRSMSDMLIRLYSPEKHVWPDQSHPRPREYGTWLLSRVYAYYILYYFNQEARDLLGYFYDYLLRRYDPLRTERPTLVSSFAEKWIPISGLDQSFFDKCLPTTEQISELYTINIYL
uniref:RdRp n=1 Tax=viral metagenome TaxID=1070528 RepID=A0A2V0RC36_9ZZZZ